MHHFIRSRRQILFAAAIWITHLGIHRAHTAEFTFLQSATQMTLSYGTDPVATYVWSDPQILRPYFKNVFAPGNIQVTRNYPPVEAIDATDHATMHPGLWLAFGDISGQDFWRNKAAVIHERFVEPPTVSNGRATFATVNRFVSKDGTPLCTQRNDFSWQLLDHAFLMIWNATFLSENGDFVFGDQEEMGLGARVATGITVKNGGTLVNDRGQKNEKESWGKHAKWTDYSGVLDGKRAGILMMPDPANFRPSWFHNRDYGAFVANPFGRNAFTREEKSAIRIRKGEPFAIRFGVVLHSSPIHKPIDLPKVYSEFLERIDSVSR